ncbi:MAG TPA: esterase [Stenotrophomonas sp.]|nr:esterase [Stenotrophomonas sp.]
MKPTLQTIAALLMAALSGTAHAQPAAPVHDSFVIQSQRLHEARTINVYLPPADAAPAHPVLYMPDGGVAEDFPHVAATVDAGIRAGRIAPLLVVGIENTQRRRDMTGPTDVDSDRRIAPVVGGSAAFRAFIAEELVPEIERRYRTTESRGIIGESLAGLFIVETLFEQPTLFDTWIAFSPSLWWNAAALTRGAGRRLQDMPALKERVLVAWGDEDNIGPHAQALSDTMRRAALPGLQWQAMPRPDLHHDTIYSALEATAIERMYPAVPGDGDH